MKANSIFRLLSVLLLMNMLSGCVSLTKVESGDPPASALVGASEQAEESVVVEVYQPPITESFSTPIEGRETLESSAEAINEQVVIADDRSEPILKIESPSDEQSFSVFDPWEGFNRRVHRFNVVMDRAVARPVARAYVEVVPAPVRAKFHNFFDNLGQPATVLNALLQGRGRHSAEALGRFLLNSTVGVAGLFDPATRLKMRKRDEDFGQTLAIWGWKRSRYIELPFLGPRTVRDVFGLIGDSPLQPLANVERDVVRVGLQPVTLIDGRASILALDTLREDIPDEYMLIMDSWLQRRNFMIDPDAGVGVSLPDYYDE